MGTAVGENYKLRWDDFADNVTSSFAALRDNEEFFDVTLATDDDVLGAHKLVLAACSPMLRSLLHRQQTLSPYSPLVPALLYLKGISGTDLAHILDFMYNGEVAINQADLDSFLEVAQSLQIKGLSEGQGEGEQAANNGGGKGAVKRPGAPQSASEPKKRPRPHSAPKKESPSPAVQPPVPVPAPLSSDADDLSLGTVKVEPTPSTSGAASDAAVGVDADETGGGGGDNGAEDEFGDYPYDDSTYDDSMQGDSTAEATGAAGTEKGTQAQLDARTT